MRLNLSLASLPHQADRASSTGLAATAILSIFFIGITTWLTVGSASAASIRYIPPSSRALGAPGCAPNWNLVNSVNPSTNNYLYGVDAVSANDVWAVGNYYNYDGGGIGGTLIEHWDGTAWTVVPGANTLADRQGRLKSVAAVSANDVWAVGLYYPGTDYQTLIEHWDGMQWSVVSSPNRVGADELLGVTAISANDIWAVGDSPGNHGTLTEHWNGSYWAIVPSPPESFGNNYILTSVSAISSNDVWAVGYQERGSGTSSSLAEHWDGTQWSIVPTPNPGSYYSSLYGVITISANDVWAVGAYSNDGGSTYPTLMLHWNGSVWSAVPGNSPNSFNDLRSVSAAAPNDIWAVGLTTDCDLCLTFDTLIEHWDGMQWSVVSSPNGDNEFNRLFGVEAVSASDVWTVGYSDQYNYPYLSDTLIERHTCTPTPTVTGTPPTATQTATSLPSATPSAVTTSTAVPATSTATTQSTNTVAPTSTAQPSATSQPSSTTQATSTTQTTATVETTATSTTQATSTIQATSTATFAPTETACTITFSDVPPANTFYASIECLACKGIISGYDDGTFRPNNQVTRGQIAKIVSNSVGYTDDPGTQIYTDVPPSNPFYAYINRLTARGYMGGYTCGLIPQEPCDAQNSPYFRPGAQATRGQISKIISNAAGIQDDPGPQIYTDVPPGNPFYDYINRLSHRNVMGGYACGTIPQEPCDTQNRPYFRWGNNTTRGQASKIDANTFFPNCQTTPAKR